MVPRLSRVAVLSNPVNPTHAMILKSVQTAALRSGIKILPVQVRTPREIESAFSMIVRENAGGVIVAIDAFLSNKGARLPSRRRNIGCHQSLRVRNTQWRAAS